MAESMRSEFARRARSPLPNEAGLSVIESAKLTAIANN
jgi:hypothetical protein